MNKQNKDLINIAILLDDHKKLQEMCKKNENFRDKIHELIIKESNKK